MSDYVTSLISAKQQQQRVADTGLAEKRFRFLGFHDRISRINVDVFHKIRKVEIAPKVDTVGMKKSSANVAELYASFFVQQLAAIGGRDKSTGFSRFQRDIRKFSVNLPLVLHFREKIIAAFTHHLQIPGQTAIPSLTELLPYLARDLRHEFFPYLGTVLDALIVAIDEKNPENMECIFSCIAYLFKFLIRSLVDNIEIVYTHYYIHLLSHKKPFIRNFAAETLSFVLRRVHPSRLKR